MTPISIIIPVYNVADYLDRCVQSCLAQTCQEFEILLVDDGSTDGSGRLCDAWAAKDTRIRVIHKANGGLSSARNAGMEQATGKYLYFLDSDDFIDPDLLADCLTAMENGADLVAFNYRLIDESGTTLSQTSFPPQTVCLSTPEDRLCFLARDFFDERIGWSAWSRMYRADLIRTHGLTFADNAKIFAEDLYFCLCYLLHANTIQTLYGTYYNYLQRGNSIMGTQNARLNFGRMNELSKAFYQYLCLQKETALLQRHFPLFHYRILENVIRRADSIQPHTVQQMRALLMEDIPDWDFCRIQFSHLPRSRRLLRMVYGSEKMLHILAQVQYFSSGNFARYNFQAKTLRLRLKISLLFDSSWRQRLWSWLRMRGVKTGIFLLGTEDFGNVGDHQIAESILQFLSQRFPGVPVKEVTLSQYEAEYRKLKTFIRPKDIIVMPGGGNIGSLYLAAEDLRKSVIETWPKNRKIVFPQSIFYADDPVGQLQLQKDQALFCGQNNVTLVLREQYSFDFAQKHFSCCSILVPDIVLQKPIAISQGPGQGKILLCLRQDVESTLSPSERNSLRLTAQSVCSDVRFCDTQQAFCIPLRDRKLYCRYFLSLLGSAQLVVTDRLHGVIFSAVTGTPCIALANANQKIEGTCHCLKHLPYLYFASSVQDACAAIPRIKDTGRSCYDVTPLQDAYDRLAQLFF